MTMGGFTGSDPAPTLAEFEKWVKAGDITASWRGCVSSLWTQPPG